MVELGGPVSGANSPSIKRASNALAIRVIDTAIAVSLTILLLPVVVALAIAIKAESRGPVLYRSRRVGAGGREFEMLKFRKMPDGAAGSPLTAPEDERFTRLGRLLARTKLDEIPQLWNVLRGHMSLVGPRPEDPHFVASFLDQLEPVLRVKPGITGLSQLAFARESEILDPNNREEHYVDRILPQKIHMDTFYAQSRSAGTNLRILYWTAAAVLLRRDVAVNRTTGQLGLRRRPKVTELSQVPAERPAPELTVVPAEQPGT